MPATQCDPSSCKRRRRPSRVELSLLRSPANDRVVSTSPLNEQEVFFARSKDAPSSPLAHLSRVHWTLGIHSEGKPNDARWTLATVTGHSPDSQSIITLPDRPSRNSVIADCAFCAGTSCVQMSASGRPSFTRSVIEA